MKWHMNHGLKLLLYAGTTLDAELTQCRCCNPEVEVEEEGEGGGAAAAAATAQEQKPWCRNLFSALKKLKGGVLTVGRSEH
jgi:hypothetical protein